MAEKKAAGPSVETAESLYDKAQEKLESDPLIVSDEYRLDNFQLAASMFDQLGDFLDAPEKAALCREKAERAVEEAKEKKYRNALRRMEAAQTTDQMEKVVEQLNQLGDYRDSAALAAGISKTVSRQNRKSAVKRGAVLTLILAAVIFVIASWYTGFFRYLMGIVYLKSGSWDNAVQTFERLDDFLDSKAKAAEAKNQELLTAVKDDVVSFGNFRWKVLDKEGTVLTMIAAAIGEDSIFYNVVFSEDNPGCGWKDSSLRRWLNGEVYENGFTGEEKKLILEQETGETVNARYGTKEAGSKDRLTLLAAEDCPLYQEALDTLSLDYYLRTPGEDMTKQSYVSGGFHQVMPEGCTKDTVMAVRPVIRVDLSGLAGVE